LTGQLGEVMKESAQAAHAYMRSRCDALQLDAEKLADNDMHIHVPEGATPKDGPSAGIALLVSMLSALRGVAPEAAVAFTGEITLRGRVLPVGGIKEKVLAAHRAGITTIVLPKENEKDFPEVPAEVRDAITWKLVEDASEVVAVAFPGKGKK
jgi:ATP-dependent Lon protease